MWPQFVAPAKYSVEASVKSPCHSVVERVDDVIDVDKSVNTTAVMILSERLIRNIILGFFVRAFGLMTLAHVGRFLTRPVSEW